MKCVLQFVAIAVLAVVCASAALAQNDSLVGTWKLNLEKSKYDPGPAPKSLIRTVEAAGDGIKYTFAGVAADGTAISYGFTVHFDGKDNPVTGSMAAGADNVSAKRVDANHYVATLKKGGKEVGTAHVSVSADGKTTTVEGTGVTATGAKSHDVQVYDKQ
jgi:hypothetical protein